MKKILFASLILLSSCAKKEDNATPAERSASFKIGSSFFTVNKPYLGIYNDNGTIKNTLTLTATDGSKVEFHFTGSTPATYTLQSYNDAAYYTAAGKQYNSTAGTLTTSSYAIDGNVYKSTGTFHFFAKAIAAPIDSLEITEGVFINASNEF